MRDENRRRAVTSNTARKGPSKACSSEAPFERAADRCDFGRFDIAALCATSAAGRRQLKSGRTKPRGIIGSDKTKTQTYCQIHDLSEQLIQAVQKKDRKKTTALAEKIIELEVPNLPP